MRQERSFRENQGFALGHWDSPALRLPLFGTELPIVRLSMFCVQVGTNNPCRCKVVGPTIGIIGAVLAALVCWPAGILGYCCCRGFADQAFAMPYETFNSIANAAPI